MCVYIDRIRSTSDANSESMESITLAARRSGVRLAGVHAACSHARVSHLGLLRAGSLYPHFAR